MFIFYLQTSNIYVGASFCEQVARSHHAAKVLGLRATQRDGLLHLGEPVDEGAVVEDEAATDREAHRPVRVNVRVETARGVGREAERARAEAAAVAEAAALQRCFWLARRPDSRSNERARGGRRLVMMRSPSCSACPARQRRPAPRSGALC